MLFFSIQNRRQDRTGRVSEAAGARWWFYRRVWLCSECVRIVFLLAEGIQGFRVEILTSEFRGRRSTWWVLTFHMWRRSLMRVKLEGGSCCSAHWKWCFICDADHWCIHFVWQVQYLVRLEGDFTCSTHWKWRFICDADHWWHSFCVAGAVFGEVGGCLLLLRALEMMFHMWCGSLMTFILHGRRSTWWSWRVTLVAPPIANDVSYVTPINPEIPFAWQAQYLVRLEGDFTCSTHWKWRFICDADHWWHWFCAAGAVLCEFQMKPCSLRALETQVRRINHRWVLEYYFLGTL